MTCRSADCTYPSRSLGLCVAHYKRYQRGLSTETPVKRNRRDFWAYVEKTNECWLWTGCVSNNGYGRFAIRGKSPALVHRHAYELLVGPIPADMTIDHLCCVKTCVNPAHMEVVTRSENTHRAHVRRTKGVAA